MGALLLLLSCLLYTGESRAASQKDVKIAVRALDFITSSIQDRSVVGIIYDPRKEDTLQDAQAILEWLSNGGGPHKPDWTPQLVDIRSLGGMKSMRAVFLAGGMDKYYDEISDYSRRSGTPTIGFDLNCVRAAKCVIGITSASRVEVLLSSPAALASRTQFSEAFRMMVTEY